MSTGVIDEPGCVRLELDNRPEHVSVVRAALGGLAEAVGFGPELATNLQTAVSEACNNIVLHAYGGQIGPMAVDINWSADQVDVVVADRGTGIQRVSGAAEHMGLGLALISALSSQAEFRSPQDGGTEVRMRFRRDRAASESGIPRDGTWHTGYPGMEGDVILYCQPVGILRHILGRLARAVASRSHFTVKGAESLFAINDAIANYAEWAGDAYVTVAITAETRRLSFEGGPFLYDIELDEPLTPALAQSAPSTADGVSQPPAVWRDELAELVDEISFVRDDGHGRLHVLVRDAGRPEEI